jgi:Meiotically up-regulated gene 113
MYVKIGLTCNLKRRISGIQTGCPLRIAHAFAIPSQYWEEARGLEKLLHMLLRSERLRAEWYEGTEMFFSVLDAVLRRINAGGFSHDDLLEMPDFVGPEFEIMLHRHEFCFYELSLPLARGADPLASATKTSPACIAALLSEGRLRCDPEGL